MRLPVITLTMFSLALGASALAEVVEPVGDAAAVAPDASARHAKAKLFTDAPAASTAPAIDDQDILTLTNQQSIFGTILEGDDPATVDINTGSGVVRIPKSLVVWPPFYGLVSQRKRLDRDGLAELVSFSKWCDARDHKADALAALDRAVGMPGIDADAIGLHARLVDESSDPNRGPPVALPMYRAYKAAGGADPDLLARLSQLETVLADHNAALAAMNLQPLDITSQTPTVVAEVQQPQVDTSKSGIEAKGAPFQSEELQWSLPVEVQVTTLAPVDGGTRVLSVVSSGVVASPPADGKRPPEKVAIKKSLTYAIDDTNSNLSFQIRNLGTHTMMVAVALKTGDRWTFYESLKQQVTPSPDFKTLNVDFKAHTFKCEASKWQNTGTIVDLDQVKELQLLIYNVGQPVDLAIQGMQLGKAPEL